MQVGISSAQNCTRARKFPVLFQAVHSIDLRSDTVTRPTTGMLEAMVRAKVGDDVYGEDPTVRALEARMAEATGKEAALFVSSGTMGNQLAFACLARPGEEVLVGRDAHPLHYESGAACAMSGLQLSSIGDDGFFTEEDIEAALRPLAYYAPRTAAIALENTHNRMGGRVWSEAQFFRSCAAARTRGLGVHLDGARLWNAVVASGLSLATWCAPCDTVSLCFSKGLGAPVGSVLVGSAALIHEARRLRKRWGGGTRQAGYMAACALYAFEHHQARIHEDHTRASTLAEHLQSAPGVQVVLPETNIVVAKMPEGVNAEALSRRCAAEGLLFNALSSSHIRLVTHMDVPASALPRAVDVFMSALRGGS